MTLAGARVHAGMRFSSVRREYKSAADAWKSAWTTTVVPLTFFTSGALGLGADEEEEAMGRAGVAAAFDGVAERLGSALTVRSFPCVSIMALGNVASFASRTAGRRVRARVNTASTSGDAAVVRDQLY